MKPTQSKQKRISKAKSLTYERIQIFAMAKNFPPGTLEKARVTEFLDGVEQGSYNIEANKKGGRNQRFKEPIIIQFRFERKQLIQLDCIDTQGHMIGMVTFGVGELVGSKQNFLRLSIKNHPEYQIKVMYEGVIQESLQETIQKKHKDSFLSYLRGNLQISVIGCIDFTASNIRSKKEESLHRVHEYELNDYQMALSSVCKIVLDYDHDQLVQLYGFGGIPLMPGFEPNQETSHFFPLTGNWQSPAGFGIHGVFSIYNDAVQNIQMSGPTLFSPMLEELIKFTEEGFKTNKYHYTILLILTDGIIHDMDETVDLVVRGSELPLSIIIVGVGDEDFTYMKQLDSDGKVLKDGLGRVAKRDIVQFVEYNKFLDKNMDELMAEVLYEIPAQVCTFYKMVGLNPSKPNLVKLTTTASDAGHFEIRSFKTLEYEMSDNDIPNEFDTEKEEVRAFYADKLISDLAEKFSKRG